MLNLTELALIKDMNNKVVFKKNLEFRPEVLAQYSGNLPRRQTEENHFHFRFGPDSLVQTRVLIQRLENVFSWIPIPYKRAVHNVYKIF